MNGKQTKTCTLALEVWDTRAGQRLNKKKTVYREGQDRKKTPRTGCADIISDGKMTVVTL